jgi:hypothetical protein
MAAEWQFPPSRGLWCVAGCELLLGIAAIAHHRPERAAFFFAFF